MPKRTVAMENTVANAIAITNDGLRRKRYSIAGGTSGVLSPVQFIKESVNSLNMSIIL